MSVNDLLLAWVFASTLLTLTPGLDTALVLRTSTIEGSRKALQVALGINTGCLIWGTLVAFGLGALITASELAWNLLKYCGAAYLCWLGLQMILRPRNTMANADLLHHRAHNWYFRGVLGNVLNPKIGVFYVSFLPQFIPPDHSPILWIFILVAIHVIIGTLWSGLLILFSSRLAHLLKRPRVVTWLDRSTGVLLLLFAARLALSRR